MRFRDMAVWFFKMAAGRHLEFCPTGNGAVGSAVPENPTLEPNMRGIGWRVEELWPFQIFPKCVNWPWGRSSVVGRQYSYFLHWSHILLFRYVSERGVYASFYVKCKKDVHDATTGWWWLWWWWWCLIDCRLTSRETDQATCGASPSEWMLHWNLAVWPIFDTPLSRYFVNASPPTADSKIHTILINGHLYQIYSQLIFRTKLLRKCSCRTDFSYFEI